MRLLHASTVLVQQATACGLPEVFHAVLKRIFEYSNIFEQGFQNEYSNTKIENRIFEKAPSTMCKPTSAAPLGAVAKASSR